MRRVSAIPPRAVLALAAAALLTVAGPVAAQQTAQERVLQRIPVSDLILRIERLESAVASMRAAPAGVGEEGLTRLDQIEAELRRLTGALERLQFDAERRAEAARKHAEDFESRLRALESGAFPTPPLVRSEPAPLLPQPVAPQARAGTPLALEPRPAPAPPSLSEPFAPDAAPDISAIPRAPGPVVSLPTPQREVFSGSAPPAPLVLDSAPSASASSAGALYEEGLRLLNLGSFDQAGAVFERLVAENPDAVEAGQAQYWLGDMHFKLGRYEMAAKAFLDSFRNWPVGPKAPDSLLKLGMTLGNLGQRDEACLTFIQFPNRYPDAAPVLLQRAQIEAQRNQCGGL